MRVKSTQSYSNQAKRSYLSISLRELGIDENCSYGCDISNKDGVLLCNLVTFSPTKQSHLGMKLTDCSKLNNRTTDSFLTSLFDGLRIKNVCVFDNYSSANKKRVNLFNMVGREVGNRLIYKCSNGIKESFFMGLRNAVAHGNIVSANGKVVLYSVADNKNEYDSPVTFFIELDRLQRLSAVNKVIDLYK